jgi:putative Mg2+ transporter-C (MgtC) family protein
LEEVMFLFAESSWDRLGKDFEEFRDFGQITLTVVRLLIAACLGGLLGYQREKTGKAAGLRTHMLVCLGSAFFVFGPHFRSEEAISRVIQGLVAGIGFLGAGAILKLGEERRIKGLTTAASIWLTAGVGIAVGLGQMGSALVCTVLALIVLGVMHRLDRYIGEEEGYEKTDPPKPLP